MLFCLFQSHCPEGWFSDHLFVTEVPKVCKRARGDEYLVLKCYFLCRQHRCGDSLFAFIPTATNKTTDCLSTTSDNINSGAPPPHTPNLRPLGLAAVTPECRRNGGRRRTDGAARPS